MHFYLYTVNQWHFDRLVTTVLPAQTSIFTNNIQFLINFGVSREYICYYVEGTTFVFFVTATTSPTSDVQLLRRQQELITFSLQLLQHHHYFFLKLKLLVIMKACAVRDALTCSIHPQVAPYLAFRIFVYPCSTEHSLLLPLREISWDLKKTRLTFLTTTNFLRGIVYCTDQILDAYVLRQSLYCTEYCYYCCCCIRSIMYYWRTFFRCYCLL